MISKSITLQNQHLDEMRKQVSSTFPEEGCGLIAGNDRVSTGVFPITNELHSPFRFRMDPQEQLSAFLTIESQGWDLLAIFHSHPEGPNFPSATDVEEFAYPGVLSIIWFLENSVWQYRCFTIDGVSIFEEQVIIS